ncbi:hypothetical protein BDA96_07G121700 [Sorghum bicolor]|uniref:Uncharacterized protein n=2 Tax=Sorghum bicolor TaxID=4558 RepID=A0A921UAB4_SORBI|nr:hypothetical protein BDA96_07G121700 [Sorghum bicolor]OQU76470.1 hypothetical protein SORBI_3010G150450 [Sorghum bicolor]
MLQCKRIQPWISLRYYFLNLGSSNNKVIRSEAFSTSTCT